ncbi:MAG: 2-oxoacid:ferredoxin oxidoreductase subunit beta, partial [Rhodospirillales bacterium]|nr:2-oxoacid:ferredoxin oxidoreductase subunit beta [Rhodospirillales bacterium]
NGVTEDDILVHDETNKLLAMMLADMDLPLLPMAIGVIYCAPNPSFDANLLGQVEEAKAKAKDRDINTLLRRGNTWEVDD